MKGQEAFHSGTEGLDWQEVWCFRCKHDHGMSHVPDHEADADEGCEVWLRAIVGDDVPEFTKRGYTVEVSDGDHLEVAPGYSIPAAIVCARFEACESQQCRTHRNGAVITRIVLGDRWGTEVPS